MTLLGILLDQEGSSSSRLKSMFAPPESYIKANSETPLSADQSLPAVQ